MLSDRHEAVAYDNGELRNQWEQRAQSFTNRDKQEKARKGKSALNGLFSEWQYRLAMRTGVASNTEKKKGDISDFRKYIVRAGGEVEVDEAKLEARFKIKPPPKLVKPASPPPPPKRKPAPKHAPRPRRKPEVDIYMCWGDSWKCLKPPRQQQKSKETEPKQTNTMTYKPMGYDLEAKWCSAATEWTQSWKQIKSPAQLELSKENKSQWDILSKGKFWRRYEAEIDHFSLPVWAGTWRTINFVLGQEQKNWDRSWPDYKQNASDKLTKLQHLEQQDQPSGWADSWRSSIADIQPQDDTEQESMTSTTIKMEIPNVFLPGWNESWMSSGVPLENGEQCQKNWQSSWGYCQERRWCKASLESRHRHINMLTRRRRNKNLLLTSGLVEEVPDATEWGQSWKTPKAYSEETEYGEEEEEQDDAADEEGEMQDEDYNDEDYYEEEYEYEVPLHLQFHKLNTSFSTWKECWMVTRAHSAKGDDGGEEGGEEGEGEREKKKFNSAWKHSWKLCDYDAQGGSREDVVYFSTKHKTRRYMGVQHVEDSMEQNQWSESWKTTKPADMDIEQYQEHEDSKYHHFRPERSTILLEFPVCDWRESWKFSPGPTPPNSYSLSYWSQSWRLSNPEQLDQYGCRKHRNQTEHHRHFDEVELPEAEWADSWKQPRSDTLDPNTPRVEDSSSGEWGACWRLLNPQLYLKNEAWSQEKTEEGKQEEKKEDLRLHLSFLSREEAAAGNRKMINPKLKASDWNESWRILKTDMDTREK